MVSIIDYGKEIHKWKIYFNIFYYLTGIKDREVEEEDYV
jgi:hypothetical protein